MPSLPSLQQLRYLIALDEAQHFGRAAEKCFITQSTLSASLRDLESTLDVTLVERDRRHIHFTPIGLAVVARARDLLAQAEDLVEMTSAARYPLTGAFRLGVIPTIAPFVLPKALEAIGAQYPKLQLYLREELSAQCVQHLQDGTLDAALLALPYDLPTGIETVSLYEDEFVFVTGDVKLGKSQGALPIERIEPEQLLLLEDGHCLRDHALAACAIDPNQYTRRSSAMSENKKLSATSLTTLTHMVQSGLGHTLLPKLAIDGGLLSGTKLHARTITPKGPARHIAIAFRKTTARGDEIDAIAAIFAARRDNSYIADTQNKTR